MNKKWCLLFILILLVIPSIKASVTSDFPLEWVYVDSSGNGLSGNYNVNLTLWDTYNGGTRLEFQYLSQFEHINGYASTIFDTKLNYTFPIYIELKLDGIVYSPRWNISSSPSAIYANNSKFLNEKPSDYYLNTSNYVSYLNTTSDFLSTDWLNGSLDTNTFNSTDDFLDVSFWRNGTISEDTNTFNTSSDIFAVANNGSLLRSEFWTNGSIKAQNVSSSMFLSQLFWTNLTIKPLNLSSSMFLSFNWHTNGTWQTGSELFVPYNQVLNTTSKVDFQDIDVTGYTNTTILNVNNITYKDIAGTAKWRTYVNATGFLITEYIE